MNASRLSADSSETLSNVSTVDLLAATDAFSDELGDDLVPKRLESL